MRDGVNSESNSGRGEGSQCPGSMIRGFFIWGMPLVIRMSGGKISNVNQAVYILSLAGVSGAWILWAKETSGNFDPGECPGYDAGSYDCGLRYCYQYIGTN